MKTDLAAAIFATIGAGAGGYVLGRLDGAAWARRRLRELVDQKRALEKALAGEISRNVEKIIRDAPHGP